MPTYVEQKSRIDKSKDIPIFDTCTFIYNTPHVLTGWLFDICFISLTAIIGMCMV